MLKITRAEHGMYFIHSHVSPDRAWNEPYIDSYPIRIRFLLDGANDELRIIHLIRVRIAFDPRMITMYL